MSKIVFDEHIFKIVAAWTFEGRSLKGLPGQGWRFKCLNARESVKSITAKSKVDNMRINIRTTKINQKRK